MTKRKRPADRFDEAVRGARVCVTYTTPDGIVMRVQTDGAPMSEKTKASLDDIARAAVKRMDEEDQA